MSKRNVGKFVALGLALATVVALPMSASARGWYGGGGWHGGGYYGGGYYRGGGCCYRGGYSQVSLPVPWLARLSITRRRRQWSTPRALWSIRTSRRRS
jgi:hypothetical protein